ncbi:MAG: GDP-mannose 4,6-dehydratase [Planctomycetes bacterium]|nr:GDP-mannose 4,6-dehydratase [Planctomycetota bacterium]
MRRALVTGITGQDGCHLAELLLSKGYRVFGSVRATGSRLNGALADSVTCLAVDYRDDSCFLKVLEEIRPDEIYNLASISFVPASWRDPAMTAEFMTVGLTRLLEAVRTTCPKTRVFQASSSEMFGKAKQAPQSEATPFHPRNPYGIAKVYGHQLAVNYRETYGLFVCSGILFNHEGPRRRLEFVTRKITHTAARIRLGMASELRLGNLESRRDWGYAGDFVRSMWLMLQQERADDFVIGTGETHTVEEFVRIAFECLDLDWRSYVVVDPEFYRPLEPELLVADESKARRTLGWQPEVGFEEMVRMMVQSDLALLQTNPSQAA